ncbi:MAG: uroporphyrinogen-III synthase [Gallionella sp.]
MANGHTRFPDGATSHSTRSPKDGDQVAGYLPNPLDKTTSQSTRLQTTAAKSLVIPQVGEGANESLRESHITTPLRGLKIAVTRPRDQAAPLAQRITQAGGIPLLFPLLDIEPVADDAPLHEQLSRLAQFDLAIFISPNAVQHGIAAIHAANVSLPASLNPYAGRASAQPLRQTQDGHAGLKPDLQIATVGQGSAKALRELGIADIIAPTERFDSEGLLALPELQNVAGWNVLIFRGDGGRELLGDTLKARGAAVEYATCYLRSKPQQDIAELLCAAPDAITVTSSEALGHLWDMLDERARATLRDTPLFVPHPRIAELAGRQGWRQAVTTPSGDDGLLSGLIAWAQKEKTR